MNRAGRNQIGPIDGSLPMNNDMICEYIVPQSNDLSRVTLKNISIVPYEKYGRMRY